MFEPTCDVVARRVMMRPVYYTATLIPFVNSVKRYFLASLQVRNTWREIDIVRNEQRVARIQPQDESLMSAAISVVRQYPGDGTVSPNLGA